MTERIPEERLGELEKEIADNDPFLLTTITFRELRALLATARREPVLAEQVRVLAEDLRWMREVYQADNTNRSTEEWSQMIDQCRKASNVTNAVLAAHHTTLAELAKDAAEREGSKGNG